MTKQSTKRIHKVTIKRMYDESPDTSWLGEYSNSPTSEYSIDRAHSLDCPINTGVTGLDSKTRKPADIAKSRCECADSKCPTADCKGKCQMAASYLLFRTDMEDSSGTMFCAGCGDDAYEAGLYVGADDDDLAEPQCDCDERGDMERNEYQYFNPSFNYVDKAGKAKDTTPAEVREYTLQDYKRMESLHRGDWSFIGIRAEAEIVVAGVCQEITSGGLWGIESDSEESYLASVHVEELGELRKQLEAIGFSKRAVSAAFRNVEQGGDAF